MFYRFFYSVFLIVLFNLSACQEPYEIAGVDIWVENQSKQEYLLDFSVYDEQGHSLFNLHMPILYQEGAMTQRYSNVNQLHTEFEGLVIKTKLISIPDARILDSRIVYWPNSGDIGVSSGGAKSSRINVSIAIKEVEGKIKLSFEELI